MGKRKSSEENPLEDTRFEGKRTKTIAFKISPALAAFIEQQAGKDPRNKGDQFLHYVLQGIKAEERKEELAAKVERLDATFQERCQQLQIQIEVLKHQLKEWNTPANFTEPGAG